MSGETSNRTLVVGAGIGGLSAALALRRSGHNVTVFEGAPRLMDVGCVHIWVNGMAALRRLGLEEQVAGSGIRREHEEFRSQRDDVLVDLPLGELARETGVPAAVSLRRFDLLQALSDALGDDVIRFGAKVVGLEQDENGVTVKLADGGEERGTALIGADGLDSRIRQTLFPQVASKYAGHQHTRAIVRFDDPAVRPGTLVMNLGRAQQFGYVLLSEGELCWWAVTVAPPGREKVDLSRKDVVLALYKDFPHPAPAAIEATPPEDFFNKDIRYIDPLERWSEGRVTLLGDAAHGTTPSLGRGAGEAIEDGVALGDALSASTSVVEGLRAYEAARREPTADVHKAALRTTRMANIRNPVLSRLRELGMKRVGGRMLVRDATGDFTRWAAQLDDRRTAVEAAQKS